MGFFDRFTAKKQPAPAPVPSPETPAEPAAPAPATAVKPRLVAAREKLEAKDLAGAVAIYEEILAGAGDRPDVLVTISGDLGTHGHLPEIIELVAPRYDAERHGPATGINLVQAYLALRNPDAAQHVLDILFSLNRPELQDRLYGFSNAIAELMASPDPAPAAAGSAEAPPSVPKVGLVTLSKPVWYYGLETLGAVLLPPKEGRFRRLAFAQLAIPGTTNLVEVINQPESELARLSRAIPLWLAETFYFSANYAPIAALATYTPPDGPARPMVFGAEWTTENLRQLVETSQGGVDYIFTGAIKETAGDYELVLRVYEAKGFRERKKLMVRWTPTSADAELGKLHAEIRRFMEWAPAGTGLSYTAPASPRTWLDILGASVAQFLAEKQIVAADAFQPVEPDLTKAAQLAASGDSASLAFLTLKARAAKHGVAAPDAGLSDSDPVRQAREVLA